MNDSESVSALIHEEYAKEAEVASFTDDDVSSHSSTAVPSSAIESQEGSLPQEEENGSEEIKVITGDAKVHHAIASKQRLEITNIKPVREPLGNLKESSSCSSSTDLSFDSESPENLHSTLSNKAEKRETEQSLPISVSVAAQSLFLCSISEVQRRFNLIGQLSPCLFL